MSHEFLWYIPNTVEAGHRLDNVAGGWANLDLSTELARILETRGWDGALIGTGWGRPDTFTVATALAARTTTFKPLAAIRPGYWHPAHFASSAATLDHLTGGRLLINIVSGQDNLAAYGDAEGDQPQRYARTREFLQIVRRLWHEDDVTFKGEYFGVANSTLALKPFSAGAGEGRHPRLYFGGASPAAERVSATEADVQLFWGEPLDGVAERIDRLRGLSESLGREHAPLEFGLRITTLIRGTSAEAWREAESRVAVMAEKQAGTGGTDGSGAGGSGAGGGGAGGGGGSGAGGQDPRGPRWRGAVGQQRLLALAERGEVLDSCLYTEPGKYGGGGAGTTWLVGSPEEVAAALRKYADLGITHFVLSDTPYRGEAARVGDTLLPLLRDIA